MKAQIIEDYGRRYVVQLENGDTHEAVTRKKRIDFACGDWVEVQIVNQEQAVIEHFLPRQSLLFRQDAFRTKLIAANVTQVGIVLSHTPSPNPDLIQRTLLAANAASIQAALIINKTDLPDYEACFFDEYLRHFPVPVIAVSAKNGDIQVLQDWLNGQMTILTGQSGMGKSTLTNALLGEDVARTGSISETLNAGRHTTTHTRLYRINPQTTLIDSPGLQSFGLNHLNIGDLLRYCPDLHDYIGQCRFHNCTHRQEPHCAIKTAVENQKLPLFRLQFLQSITDEIERGSHRIK